MSDGDLLTIGLAVYQDLDGAYFTLQSLHMHHPRVQYLVVDNAPAGDGRLRAVTEAVGGRYLHRPDLHGTSAPRDALFRLARTPWVMCLDSHVLLETGAVQALLDYARAHPHSDDLIQGPLVLDDGRSNWTHWHQATPPGLWGTWATDSRWQGRESFEIPMQGLGLFGMRREAWPGFHPLFRGFGGEEGYIHEKVRQAGGKCRCLPALRWRHKFRHMEHGAPPPPYPFHPEDHCWNLLLGHRELGVDGVKEMVREQFGKSLPPGIFDALASAAEKAQPFGQIAQRKRMRLLGVWYTNNAAPEPLLQRSLRTIHRASVETMHHDVKVVTSTWSPVGGNPFPCVAGRPHAQGHAAIVEQIRRGLKHAEKSGYEWDALVCLEHDVLYPPAYFDRLGQALATGAPIVSHQDYEGCNATGWLKVKDRHEPMHQIALRRDVALANLDRAEADCKRQGWAYLEPDSGDRGPADRSHWARIPFEGLSPSIHVNW